MDESNGYIYVLINPSMEGIVKIGKTTRDPVNRVKELSSATGVPTPFILVYTEMFNDCTLAEVLIHSYLEENQYRVSANREFFNIPVYEAIKIVQKVKQSYDKVNTGIAITNTDTEDYGKLITEDLSPVNSFIEELLEKADDYYYGYNGLQDYEEALVYYEKAEKAGSIVSLRRIGIMYYYGEGVTENTSRAIKYLKKAARLGDTTSYGELARIYSILGENYHGENKLKCWDLFFDGIRKKGINDNSKDYFFMCDTILEAFSLGIEVKYTDILHKYKNKIMETMGLIMNMYKQKGDLGKVQEYEDAHVFIELLEESEL